MKKQSTALYVLRLAVTLLLIAGVVAAVLAGVNTVTAPIIEKLNAEKTQQAINAVLEGGGEPMDFAGADTTGLVTAVYASDLGYAIQVKPSGFDGEIDMMVGVGKDGKVLSISIISHTETAGLGAVAAASTSAGESFRSQFTGASGTVGTAKRGTGTVDAITGATITSEAVCTGVNAALACAANLG